MYVAKKVVFILSESEVFEILCNIYECKYYLDVILSDIEIYHKEEFENYHNHINSFIGGKND